MRTATAVALLVLLVGCTNTPIRFDDDCTCNSQIQAAVEFGFDADSELQTQIDDLACELDAQKRRIEALDAAVAALEDEGAP